VTYLHAESSTLLFQQQFDSLLKAQKTAARYTRKLENLSAYVMPGFFIYKNGRRKR